MKKIIYLIGIFFVFLFPLAHVSASTTTVGDLQVTAERPMFSENEIWYPGLTLTKTVTIKNLGTVTHTPFIESFNTFQSQGMADILTIVISENSVDTYGGQQTQHLSDFWHTGKISFADLATNQFTNIQFTVSMPKNAGDEFQGAQAKFDLKIGFAGTGEQIGIGAGSATGDGLSDGKSDGLSDGRSDGRSSSPIVTGLTGGQVLGATFLTPTPTPTPPGQILGQHTTSGSTYIFLWFLILLLIVLLLWILLRKRRQLPHIDN